LFMQKIFIIFSLLTGVLGWSAAAATMDWSGAAGGTAWSTGSNWNGGVAPASTDSARFNQTSYTRQPAVNVASAIEGLQIGDGTTATAAVTVTATNTLTLGAGGITLSANAGAATLTGTAAGVILGAAQAWTNNAATTLTISAKVTNGANLLTVDGSGSTVVSGVIGEGSGGVAKSGGGTLTLSGANSYSGGTTLSAGTLLVGDDSALGTGALSLNDGATLAAMSSATRTLANNGVAGGDFTLGQATGGTGQLVLAGTLDLGGARRQITVNNEKDTISGVISGAGGITKAGAGALALAGANSYSGGTTLATGTLNLNHAQALGTGTFTITGGTIGNTSGAPVSNANHNAQNWNGDFAFDGPNNVNLGAGAVTLGGNRTVSINRTYNTLTVGGVIDDGVNSYSLTKTGSGELTLAGANSYDGGTILNEGKLSINHAQALGTGALTINGGTLDNSTAVAIVNTNNNAQNWNGDFTFHGTRGLDLGTGDVTLGGNRTVTSLYNTLTVSGIIDDGVNSYSLTKAGAGSFTLAGANRYDGGTMLNEGTLYLNHAQALGSGMLTINGGNLGNNTAGPVVNTNHNAQNWNGDFSFIGPKNLDLGTGAVTLGKTLTVTTKYGILTVGGDLADGGLNYGLTKAGAATLALSGANGYTGVTTVQEGTLSLFNGAAISDAGAVVLANAGTALLKLNAHETIGSLAGGGSAGGNVNLQGYTLTTGDAGNTSYAGSLSGAGGHLTKTGAGTLTLSGVNSYTGGTTITAGTLSVAASAALGPESNPLTIGGDGTLKATGSFNSSRATTLGGTGAGQGGTFEVDAGATLNYAASSVISGTGSLIKTGAGTLSLGGVNTYTGGTYIKAGTLVVTSGQAAGPQPPAGSNLYAHHIYDGATLQIAVGSWATERQVELVGDQVGTGGVAKIDITNGFTQQRNGLIYGDGKLDLVGAGRMTVTTANTYTGGTLVETGTLQVNNRTGSATGTGAVTVTNGGTLSGLPTATGTAFAGVTGAIAGTVNILDTGKLLAASGGTLTLGGLTLDTGALSTFQLGALTTTPLITITGDNLFTLSGNSTIDIINTGLMAAGTYHLFDYTGTTPDFAKLALAEPHSGLFNLSLLNNTSNSSFDLYVTAFEQQWKKGGTDTNWSTTGNWWTGVAPNGAGAAALFLNNNGYTPFGATETATLDTSKTVGSVAFNNPNTAFTIEAASGTTLTLAMGGGGQAEIQVFNAPATANHVISAPMILADNLIIDIAAGSYGLELSGAISGDGKTLTKTGSGPLTLSGATANSYTGVTDVTGGTLTLNKTAGVDAIGSGGLQIAPGTTVALLASNQIADSATVTLNGTLALGAQAETVAALTGGGAVTMTTGGRLTVDGNADSSFIGVISGDGGLTKAGAGAMTLAAANSYSGGTMIAGGALKVSSDGNLGDLAGGLTFDGGTLTFLGGFTTARTVTLDAGGGTFDTNNNRVVLTGPVSGSGSLIKTGLGTLELRGDNPYTGTTIVNQGVLRISTANALGMTGTTVNGAEAEIEINGGITLSCPLTLNGGVLCNLTGTNTHSGPITLTANSELEADSGTLVVTGAISGAFGLTKSGPGTVTLTANHSYTGPTSVTLGTLKVNGAIASTVTVDSRGILAGSGTVGAVILDGTLAPGDGDLNSGIGILTAAGNAAWTGDAAYQWELGNLDPAQVRQPVGTNPAANYDQFNQTNGTLAISSGFTLNVASVGDAETAHWNPSQSYEWVVAKSSNTITSAAGGALDPATILLNTAEFAWARDVAFNFYLTIGGAGNTELVLNYKSVVPEPGMLGLLALGAAALAARRRRTN
jgi:autotransporter-associated beta strand protein